MFEIGTRRMSARPLYYAPNPAPPSLTVCGVDGTWERDGGTGATTTFFEKKVVPKNLLKKILKRTQRRMLLVSILFELRVAEVGGAKELSEKGIVKRTQ